MMRLIQVTGPMTSVTVNQTEREIGRDTRRRPWWRGDAGAMHNEPGTDPWVSEDWLALEASGHRPRLLDFQPQELQVCVVRQVLQKLMESERRGGEEGHVKKEHWTRTPSRPRTARSGSQLRRPPGLDLFAPQAWAWWRDNTVHEKTKALE